MLTTVITAVAALLLGHYVVPRGWTRALAAWRDSVEARWAQEEQPQPPAPSLVEALKTLGEANPQALAEALMTLGPEAGRIGEALRGAAQQLRK